MKDYSKWGSGTDAILRAFIERGPMTKLEVMAAIGADRDRLGATLSRLSRASKKQPKRVYIVQWVSDVDVSARCYLRPVYAIGDAPDAPKPKPEKAKAVVARYRKNNRRRLLQDRHQALFQSAGMWAGLIS